MRYPISLVVSLVVPLAMTSGCKSDRLDGRAPDAATSAQSAVSAVPRSTVVPVFTAEQEKAAQSAIVNDCLSCHSEQMLVQQRLTAKQWAAVVKKMQGWGSLIEPSSVEGLVAFLAARYGTTTPPYVVPLIDAITAAEALAPLPDGPLGGGSAKKGEVLYKEACASCHGAGALGSVTGVNLTDRPGLFRAAEFAAVVRKGRGRMPAFAAYENANIADILAFVRSIRPAL